MGAFTVFSVQGDVCAQEEEAIGQGPDAEQTGEGGSGRGRCECSAGKRKRRIAGTVNSAQHRTERCRRREDIRKGGRDKSPIGTRRNRQLEGRDLNGTDKKELGDACLLGIAGGFCHSQYAGQCAYVGQFDKGRLLEKHPAS